MVLAKFYAEVLRSGIYLFPQGKVVFTVFPLVRNSSLYFCHYEPIFRVRSTYSLQSKKKDVIFVGHPCPSLTKCRLLILLIILFFCNSVLATASVV
jgi:hypothetical protein